APEHEHEQPPPADSRRHDADLVQVAAEAAAVKGIAHDARPAGVRVRAVAFVEPVLDRPHAGVRPTEEDEDQATEDDPAHRRILLPWTATRSSPSRSATTASGRPNTTTGGSVAGATRSSRTPPPAGSTTVPRSNMRSRRLDRGETCWSSPAARGSGRGTSSGTPSA